jgi:RNA polymerase sigma factor (sigma-70 family)
VDRKRSPRGATLEALAEVYERGFHTYLRVAEAIVGDPYAAHEVVQEAFARAIRSRSGYRETGSLEGWIWRTLVNTARTVRRDSSPPHVPLQELREEPTGPTSDEKPDDLRAAVAALPDRQRLVLFLRYYADLDYRAIADALEIETGTVAATLSQAHAALKQTLVEAAR